MPTTTLYTAHILPVRPFLRTATTPVDIKHSTFKSLSAFLRASEKEGLLKLKHARPEVQLGTKMSGDDVPGSVKHNRRLKPLKQKRPSQ
ncbi:hypothetical protein H4582DRAFT_2092038 [Lactarius indigo]|nr:hypothetical protein H4582DRAFT_2092038 [Lactarius indigo]